MATNPLTDLFDGLFGGIADFFTSTNPTGDGGPEMYWDPIEYGRIRLRWPNEPAPVFPIRQPTVSLRDDLRINSGARISTQGLVKNETTTDDTNVRKTSSTGSRHKPGKWTTTNPAWKSLNNYQKAATMALMEADKANPEHARHVLASMVNRAQKRKIDLGEHVSSRAYQPSFEPAQERRLASILKHPQYGALTQWVERYDQGLEDDPTGGATHFLAHPKVMLALEAKNPRKYRSWRSWTRFDPATGDYGNVTFRDRSHSFLAPEGRYSVTRRN